MTKISTQPHIVPGRGLRNFALHLISEIMAQVIAVGLAIYLARKLGVNGFGIWVFASTIIAYFAVVVEGGTETWGMREVGAHPERLKQAIIGVMLLRTALCAVTLLVLVFGTMILPREQGVALLFGTSSLFVLILNTSWAHRGLELATPALTTLIQRLAMVALVIVMVRSPSDAVHVTFWQGLSEAIGAAILLVTLHRRLRKTYEGDVPPPPRKLLKEVWPFGVSRVLRNFATAGGAVVLGFTWSTEDVGFYGAALRVATVLVIVSTIFNNAAFPALTRACKIGLDTEEQALTAAVRLLAILVTPMVVGGLVLSDALVRVVFSPEFSQAALPLAILLCALFCLAHADLMRRILAARHLQHLDLKLTARASALAVVAMVTFTPLFGSVGAASAMLLGELGLLILVQRAVTQTGPGTSLVTASVLPFMAAFLMALLVFALRDYSLWVRLTAGLSTYLFLMSFARESVLDDLRNLGFLSRPASPSSSLSKS